MIPVPELPPQKAGLRSVPRPKKFHLQVSEEEYELIFEAAGYTGDFAASWARDVLISRALGLRAQRNLMDAGEVAA